MPEDQDDASSRTRPPGDPPSTTENPALPDVATEERAADWGDDPDARTLDWYRQERPPHHE